jgi:type III secretory pathway component EscS
MISRQRLAFLFRRWYWNQPYHTRVFLKRLPDIIVAVVTGLIIGILAAAGF